ncbi:cytochrome p450 [Diaporthe amygdali]|uniref:cytochrome p450 n=1 Tax=Phomopsis amygdali TaxID=1214568 RepID=UPI0022FE7558|nr:cytochrome p450 [Diaporthe amygdali]KAJ0118711.1 cytochrome p450 [Diaporthe amygdali]
MSLLQAGLALVSLSVLLYLVTAIHSWYRLRHIPGPFFGRFSYLYLAYLQQSGRQYYIYRDELTKFGHLVRVGPNELTTDDPDVLRRLTSARAQYTRDAWYTGGRWNPYTYSMFTTLDTRAHDDIKAKTAIGYGDKNSALEPGVDAQITSFVGVVRNKYLNGAKLLDFGTLTSYFTMDVITKAGFGEAFGYLEKEEDLFDFLAGVRDNWQFMGITLDVPWLRDILYSSVFLKLLGPRMTDEKGLGKLMKVGHDVIEKRMAKPKSARVDDMLGSFLSHGLTQDQCENEALFMIVAGSETTASVIRVTVLHILSAPMVYHRLKNEVKEAIKDGRVSHQPIKIEEAKRLPYLQAVIYEGMRMRSPAPGLYPKVVPAGGDTLCGKFVPEGTAIGMNTSAMLASTRHFGEDANLFRPERFLEVDDTKRSEMQRNVELIFGNGRWMCAGRPVAFMELNKIFFELFRNFDLQLAHPMTPWDSASWPVWVDENMELKVTESA